MMFKFFGGAQEVGRSSILMKDSASVLLDFGVKLLERPEYPTEIPEVDAVILSHAHIDHCGAVPTLYNDMFIPTFGTEPTLELSELLLQDSLKIARKEHLQERFHKRQIKSMQNRYVPLAYGTTATFKNLDITMTDAGHICGSAITLIERKGVADNKRIVYTGDFKSSPQYLHKGAKPVKADVLVMESTYALREHPPREEVIKGLVEQVKAVLDNGGNAVLPAFAVGRAQELLVMMYRSGLIDRTFVDGMARTATKIVLKNKGFIDNADWLNSAVSRATFVETPGRPGRRSQVTIGNNNDRRHAERRTGDRLHNKAEPQLGHTDKRVPGGGHQRQDPTRKGDREGRRKREESTHKGVPPRPLRARRKGGALQFCEGQRRKNHHLRAWRPRCVHFAS